MAGYYDQSFGRLHRCIEWIGSATGKLISILPAGMLSGLSSIFVHFHEMAKNPKSRNVSEVVDRKRNIIRGAIEDGIVAATITGLSITTTGAPHIGLFASFKKCQQKKVSKPLSNRYFRFK